MANEPQSRLEWQEAADAAAGALGLESARTYGLVSGGPTVNVARCHDVLGRARAQGIEPAFDAVEQFARELAEGKS